MSNVHPAFRGILATIENELSRDRWLAGDAARRISERTPLREIESEPLEALAELIRAELLDRDVEKDPALQELF